MDPLKVRNGSTAAGPLWVDFRLPALAPKLNSIQQAVKAHFNGDGPCCSWAGKLIDALCAPVAIGVAK